MAYFAVRLETHGRSAHGTSRLRLMLGSCSVWRAPDIAGQRRGMAWARMTRSGSEEITRYAL